MSAANSVARGPTACGVNPIVVVHVSPGRKVWLTAQFEAVVKSPASPPSSVNRSMKNVNPEALVMVSVAGGAAAPTGWAPKSTYSGVTLNAGVFSIGSAIACNVT
jgi:hypothetical protein